MVSVSGVTTYTDKTGSKVVLGDPLRSVVPGGVFTTDADVNVWNRICVYLNRTDQTALRGTSSVLMGAALIAVSRPYWWPS